MFQQRQNVKKVGGGWGTFVPGSLDNLGDVRSELPEPVVLLADDLLHLTLLLLQHLRHN